MSGTPIRHTATIKQVGGGKIILEIAAQDACGSCSAKKICGSGETKTFTLEDDGMPRQSGDTVTLVISKSMGFLAIAVAYLVPIFIVVGLLLAMQHYAVAEMTAAWITLAILALYFVILRLCRNQLQKQITITIE